MGLGDCRGTFHDWILAFGCKAWSNSWKQVQNLQGWTRYILSYLAVYRRWIIHHGMIWHNAYWDVCTKQKIVQGSGRGTYSAGNDITLSVVDPTKIRFQNFSNTSINHLTMADSCLNGSNVIQYFKLTWRYWPWILFDSEIRGSTFLRKR
jgi:hypothetical protein